ncbi:MAG: NADH-quinone oxidoreductase subunit NuoK [Verrucomicrobia bacterium]|nr:NADH-quinone oxidoreductase subunit NuoK [Verrucomicrobiota bacterium]
MTFYLALSVLLFCVGLAGVLARRHAIMALIGIELMLNAANINFIAFWRHSSAADDLSGMFWMIFSVAIAAAEAAVGLALVILVFRHRRSVRLDELESLKG